MTTFLPSTILIFWGLERKICLSHHPCFLIPPLNHSLFINDPPDPMEVMSSDSMSMLWSTTDPLFLDDFNPWYCLNLQPSSCEYSGWFQYLNRLSFFYCPLIPSKISSHPPPNHPFLRSCPWPCYTKNCFPFSSILLSNYCILFFQFTLPGILLQHLFDSTKTSNEITLSLSYHLLPSPRPHLLSFWAWIPCVVVTTVPLCTPLYTIDHLYPSPSDVLAWQNFCPDSHQRRTWD